jgi:hypothetical protein
MHRYRAIQSYRQQEIAEKCATSQLDATRSELCDTAGRCMFLKLSTCVLLAARWQHGLAGSLPNSPYVRFKPSQYFNKRAGSIFGER